jgi:hypothetical protein
MAPAALAGGGAYSARKGADRHARPSAVSMVIPFLAGWADATQPARLRAQNVIWCQVWPASQVTYMRLPYLKLP